MHARVGLGATTAVIVTVLFLALPGALASGVPSRTAISGDSTAVKWAYGAFKTVSLSGKGVDPTSPYQYTISAYYGWQVILSQTNVSSTVSEVEINRTVGLTFYASYCRPDCSAPYAVENVTVLYFETGAGFANLTSASDVYVGGSPVAATGILNESAESHSTYTDLTSADVHGLLPSKMYSWDFAAQSNGSVAIGFSPALGLYPNSLSNGTTWNSTAAYSATGGWADNWTYAASPLTGVPVSHGLSSSGAVERNGTLELFGSDLGDVTLSTGAVVQALSIAVVGPFLVREGFLVLPTDSDALPSTSISSPTGSSAGVENYGNLSLAGNAIDVRNVGVGHAGFLASSAQFDSVSSAPAAAAGTTSALQPSVNGPADGPGTVSVQAEPETVPQAQSGAACLTSGTCPLGSAASASGLRGLGIALVAVVVVSVLALALFVERRRREPASPRPNAQLYPVAPAPAKSAPVPGGRPPAPPPAEPADPLGNLW
ncbi:MAG: hypothetical protein L3K17_02300 [Thermoplasmata archaeon]|nr:hypothetical protein [Thermoplasmata archaeon]